MTQRDLLKGRVKRLLKEQKDMGQMGESAVLSCASVLRIFVKDLASEMLKQSTEGRGLTPIELKKSVLASENLSFLHEKVMTIDESAIKYHKPARSQKKRAPVAVSQKSSTKKSRTTKAATTSKPAIKTKAVKATKAADLEPKKRPDGAQSTAVQASAIQKTQPLLIEEDEDYDESDSDA